MKAILFFTSIFILTVGTILAQAPAGFKYQAVLRDNGGNPKANENVTITVRILQGSSSGTILFAEDHKKTTNSIGLVNLEIGDGSNQINTIEDIDWGNGPFFLKVIVDGTEMGTSQLLSVPFALHAKTAEKFIGSIDETDPLFGSSIASSITEADTSKWNNKSDFSGDYDDLVNKPKIDVRTQIEYPDSGFAGYQGNILSLNISEFVANLDATITALKPKDTELKIKISSIDQTGLWWISSGNLHGIKNGPFDSVLKAQEFICNKYLEFVERTISFEPGTYLIEYFEDGTGTPSRTKTINVN
jgi:hypothetical protein